MNATIKDIAAKSGVSVMTVSRVINNSGYVAAETREKVESAIKELDYQPNLFARSLINRKSSFVYVIVPDISNPFYAELTKGVEKVARKNGYNIILSSAYWDESLEREHIESSRGRMAEGIILVLPKMSEKKILEYSRKKPLIVVDKHIKSKEIDNIFIDQSRGVYQAVEHLINQGHSRIAFLSGSKQIYNSISRQHGYEQALKQYNIPVDENLIFSGNFSFESGENAYAKILKLPAAKRPTALFAASDIMALGFMRSCFRNGLKIPDDISVVGFDDINLSSITNPALTTVRHPYILMGKEAMKKLICTLDNRIYEQNSELVDTLKIRETSCSPKK